MKNIVPQHSPLVMKVVMNVLHQKGIKLLFHVLSVITPLSPRSPPPIQRGKGGYGSSLHHGLAVAMDSATS